MLDTRFRELAKKEAAPFLSASVSGAEALDVFDGESLDVRCNPEKWREALAAGEQELRRAIEHGFHQAELDEVRADALRGLDESVQREPTANSQALLGRILVAAERRSVPANAETIRRIVRPAVEALTVQACHEALRKAWSEGDLVVTATGNIDLGEDAGQALQRCYEASAAVKVEPPAETAAATFAYASDPAKAGAVASRQRVEDLDFEQVRFANGVALNVKRTDFKKNQVLMSVQVGEGALTTATAEWPVLQMIGPAAMNGGGLVAHSADDLRRLTAGKQVGVGFSVGQDRFQLGGSTTASDLLLQCELACAFVSAPGWREEGLVPFRRNIPAMYEQMKHLPQGPLLQQFLPALFSGDPRYAYPAREALEAAGVATVREWLAPILADAPVEVTLVGDLDPGQAVAAVARTFGCLPPRRAWRSLDERRVSPAPRPGLKQTHSIETKVPKSLVFLAFPATDGIEWERRRKLEMLAEVLRDRLRIEVREKLGASYSPGAGVQASTVSPGVGLVLIQAMSDPDKVETLVQACLGVAGTLAKDGVSEDELKRLLEPILNRRRDAKRQNGWWLETLSRSQSDPSHLPGVRAGDAFYASVKPADLNPFAREYLEPGRASILVVNPAPAK
jgi:zinc protease